MTMKQNSRDTKYSYPQQRIKIEVQTTIDRHLSEEESYFIDKCIDQISTLLRNNTVLTDPDHIKEVDTERELILECFSGTSIYVKEIPNQYSESYLKPWFEVVTPVGKMVIGWRKRVICLSWDESDIKATAQKIFPYEDTTKFDKTIHAWGYDKAKEYINTLLTLPT